MIIGIIFGALLVILIFTVLLWILRKRQRKSGSHKRQDVSHKLGNSVGSNDVKEQQEDVDLTLLDTNIMEKPSRLGAYEGLPTSDLDSYDPLTRDIGLSPNVWVVNDHMPAKPNWENPLKPEFSFHIPPPPHVEKRLSVRSPIPVPMPVPPCDLHSRLQNELADTFRRRDEHKPFERERGDGSSEMKPHEHENDPKELPKQDPDDDILNKLLSPLKSEENAPDLLSRPHQVIEPTPVIENPSAYFRPIQDVTSQNKGDKTPEVFEGGVDGTEV
ncbi:uncharacterized protein LOC143256026 isoform X1 [Tachypleus tridentatus]|uniref:uncharacterized protein LOC143256026 isoform X1 n=1 Tax=Tachypleus tridentatus TaxID=6853 RepID=UPI003FD69860